VCSALGLYWEGPVLMSRLRKWLPWLRFFMFFLSLQVLAGTLLQIRAQELSLISFLPWFLKGQDSPFSLWSQMGLFYPVSKENWQNGNWNRENRVFQWFLPLLISIPKFPHTPAWNGTWHPVVHCPLFILSYSTV